MTPEQCAELEALMDGFGLEVVLVGPGWGERLRREGFNMDRVLVVTDPFAVQQEPGTRPHAYETNKGPRNRWGQTKRKCK